MSTKNRGFASMKPEERSRIASLGGKAVSGDKPHMARIGRKGGEMSGINRKAKITVVAAVPEFTLTI